MVREGGRVDWKGNKEEEVIGREGRERGRKGASKGERR